MVISGTHIGLKRMEVGKQRSSRFYRNGIDIRGENGACGVEMTTDNIRPGRRVHSGGQSKVSGQHPTNPQRVVPRADVRRESALHLWNRAGELSCHGGS